MYKAANWILLGETNREGRRGLNYFYHGFIRQYYVYRAERNLRPNVIMRNITFGNISISDARRYEIIMSILQTGILKDIEPFDIFISLTTIPLKSYEDVLNIRPPPK